MVGKMLVISVVDMVVVCGAKANRSTMVAQETRAAMRAIVPVANTDQQ